MAGAEHRTIYTLVNDGVDFGEASTQDGLQKLYDLVTDSIVQKIRTNEGYTKKSFVKNIHIEMQSLDANGVYIRPPTGRPLRLADLIDKHADFFRYFSAYERDLYTDRELYGDLSQTLLTSIETRRLLQEHLVSLQKAWFEEQLGKGSGVHISKYPVWDDVETQISVLNKTVAEALQSIRAGRGA
jgi:hypothetical protein